MIQKLSSIKFTFYNLILMICMMGTGVYLSRSFKQSFNMLNQSSIFEWINTVWLDTPVLAVWFVLLCCSSALLFINVLFCSLTKQINKAMKSGMLQKWLFFILHCLFIVVLACHGLTLVMGSKKSNVILFPNESVIFENKYKIEASEVIFNSDINILKADRHKQRAMMTRENINRKDNFVRISLFENSKLLESKKVFMLSPLKYRFLQVTLTEFIARDGRIAVNINVTKNILNTFFFIVYAFMILALGLYILFTFKTSK